MKLKYIFASIAATLALAVSCTKEADQHYLNEIKVSTSYVSLPVDGGTASLTITATDSWAFAKAVNIGTEKAPVMAELPTWLTASTLSGTAGEVTVTFSAEKTLDGRTTELQINCGGKTQRINVIQGLATVSNATCAEVIAGPDSKNYRVTGVVTSIVNTTYGNWYLNDGTGEVYIYGTLDSKGAAKNFLSWGLEVGDEITVEGPKTTYNGTVELVDVTVISITKSLIKVETVDPEDATIAKEGGDLVVTLANKGNNLSVEIPEDVKAWLGISALAGDVVTLTAAANEGGDREGTVIFKTTDGKKDYTAELTITQKGAILDVTVKEALAVIDKLADNEITAGSYRVSGVVAKVTDLSTSYGNATYLISADGTEENAITVFRGMYIDGERFTDEKQLAAGDVVVVLGKLQRYVKNGALTPEIATGSSLVSVDRPVSVADALKTIDALADGGKTTETYYVKGIVTGDAGIDTGYGNATFTITDDGKAESPALTVFRAKDFGNEKFTSKDAFKAGDVVILIGNLQKYVKDNVMTPELSSGYLVGLIPGTAGDEPGDEPGGDEVTSPVTITTSIADFPTTYPSTETSYTLGGVDYYFLNVANFGYGIQFKKGGSYLANKTDLGRITKIECVWQDGKDFHPENFTLTVGTEEKPTATTIEPTTDATAKTAVYTVSGNNGFFMMKNASNYAGYWNSIKVYFDPAN